MNSFTQQDENLRISRQSFGRGGWNRRVRLPACSGSGGGLSRLAVLFNPVGLLKRHFQPVR